MQTLRPFEELRDPKKVPRGAPARNTGEVKMAKLLIDQLSTDGWDPSEHPNAYRKALRKMLASRAAFPVGKTSAQAPEGQVVDLMAALRKSVERAKGRPKKSSARRGAA